MPVATPTPGATLLTPTDHALILIDFQSQMAFATKSIDTTLLRNNAGLVASAAAEFNVPTILTTVAEKSFSGPMFDEVTAPFPGQPLFDRTSMNTWEDAAVIAEVNRIGKGRIVLAGLWTGVCIVGPTLSAIDRPLPNCLETLSLGRATDSETALEYPAVLEIASLGETTLSATVRATTALRATASLGEPNDSETERP